MNYDFLAAIFIFQKDCIKYYLVKSGVLLYLLIYVLGYEL